MARGFLKTLSWISLGFTFLAGVSSLALSDKRFCAGVCVGSVWFYLNLFFLFRILEIAMRADCPKKRNKIFILSVLKFPVLYLAGFFILRSQFFPVGGILTGLTVFLLAFGVAWSSTNFRVSDAVPKGHVKGLMAFFLVLTCPFGTASGQCAETHGSSLHTTNLISLISYYVPEPAARFLNGAENIIFGVLVITVLSFVFYLASRNIKMVPGRLQCACEAVVEGLNGFVCGILGPEGRKYTPFLGTLFLYILAMNLIGIVPLMKSNTANSTPLKGPVALPVPTTTVALALVVFFTVQIIGIKKQGLIGYIDHMAGTPRGVFGFVMAPLMLPIHIIGELAKPFSLTFRLFCNTMGGHILVAVFIGMGVASFFIPFQAPFLIFEIATSTIQAFVFTLLSTVYIAMMLPHGHGEKRS